MRTRLIIIATCLLIYMTSLVACAQNDTIKNDPQVLTPIAFKEQIEKHTVQLIDVRTPAEYESGHINGARLINFFDTTAFHSKIDRLDKTKPVYLYCRTGKRSHQAAIILRDKGFKHVYDLAGGYNNWLKYMKSKD